MCISIGHLSALCQEIVSPLSNWESDTLGNTQIRRPLWERTAFSRTNCPYPSDIPADGSANGSSPREKFLGTSENTRWKLRWVEEVGPQPESRAIANAKWLRDNFCLSSCEYSPGWTATTVCTTRTSSGREQGRWLTPSSFAGSVLFSTIPGWANTRCFVYAS